MNYYEKNLEVLKEFRPQIMEGLSDIQIVKPIKDKDETMYNARKAVDFLGDVAKEGVFVLMGFGMGYFLKAINEKLTNGHRIIAYEPNKGVFKHMLEKVDMTKMLASDKVYLLLGDVDNYWFIHHCHDHMVNGRLWLIKHKNFHNGDKEKCDEFYTKFVDEKRLADINMGTQIGMGKTFMNAIMDNIPQIIKNDGVISLKGMLKNKPVVIVAAGPFLEKNVDRLKDIKNKAMIICVDTALPFLLKHDIVPDIVTGIDPLNDNCALYRDERVKHIPLVCMSQYTHKIVKDYPGRIFFSSMPGNQIFVWLQWYWDEKGAIECFGGSVSHFSFSLAEYMEAGTIALIGHDYCFKSNYYVGNADRMLYDEAERKDPFPDETKDAIETENMYGEKVFIKPVLMSFRTAIENRLQHYPGKVLNLSDGGVKIKGTTEMKVDDFIKEYCTETIDYEAMLSNCSSSNKYQIDELIRACNVGKGIFRKINFYSLKILTYIHEAKKLRDEKKDKETRKILRRIEKMRHNTIHPLLEIMSGYHTILELYLKKQEIQDIDEIKDEWKRREAQMMRGLNYYGELSDAINKFLTQLDSLIKELKAMRKKDNELPGFIRPAAEG